MTGPDSSQPAVDFHKSPYLVLWELTRACALACRHCRAMAIRRRAPGELLTQEAAVLLKQLRGFGKPLIVLTGGDPIERPDVFEIIDEARRMDFPVAMTPSATPASSEEIIRELSQAGLKRLAISIDGPDASTHDAFRRVKGSFDWSMSIVSAAQKYGLPVQINTTICRDNLQRFEVLAKLVELLGAALWSVFFLVPVGRARNDMQISAEEAESILQRMADLAQSASFDVKATAAPHFRRVLIERFAQAAQTVRAGAGSIGTLRPVLKVGALRSYQSVNDGKGLMFISHTGDMQPSGFLPLPAGNVRTHDPVQVYREHELFKDLRDPSLLKGKCGTCRYRAVCGGSRARAYGTCGDYLAEDPLCVYREDGSP